MYDRILLPTDGSDPADAAADAAIAFAKRFDATLDVLHVLELGELPPGVEDEGADEFAQQGEEATNEVVDRASEAGLEATASVIEGGGQTHEAILEYVADNEIDCIVMGTSGRSGLDRLVLGSVAERTLRESPVPVLTVHEETAFDPEFESILLPTDGSECAQLAAEHAIEFAEETGAALHIIHVVDLGMLWGDSATGAVLEALEEAGQRALDQVIERTESADVSTVEATVLNGTPHEAIETYAQEHDVDCIVMGSHGRTGVDRLLLGSVTERVVRTTDVPVLSLSDGEEEEQ
jgi:nucleotide-binding universal stress UspA family protein